MKETNSASAIIDALSSMLHISKDVQLAAALSVSPQAISQARKKNKIPEGWLFKAASQYGISLDALLFGKNGQNSGRDTDAESVPSVRASVAVPADEDKSKIDFLLVPLVAARLSAGAGSLETEGEILGRFAFREDWLTRRGNPDTMVLMRVYGDSMEPTICHGDMVLVDQGKRSIVPHTIYAVRVNEEIYIKQVETLPGHRMVLRSHNERYEPIEIDLRGDLAESVQIIGRIIWWCREA